MTTNGKSSRYLASIGLFVMVLVIPAITSADCLKDRSGEVYCGAGRCLTDSNGIVWCSRYHDGHAERTSDGQVHCVARVSARNAVMAHCSVRQRSAVLSY